MIVCGSSNDRINLDVKVFHVQILGKYDHQTLDDTRRRKGIEVLFPWFQGLVLYPSDCTSWQQQDLSRQYVLGMCDFLH